MIEDRLLTDRAQTALAREEARLFGHDATLTL
jgi:hypothetical protein